MAGRVRRYRVVFHQQGRIYEIYAKKVVQGELFGFVQVEGILFGEKSQVVVDPSEEGLKREFEGVRRFQVPIHAVLRIDEVDREGASRVTPGEKGSRVTPFPGPIYTPRPGGK